MIAGVNYAFLSVLLACFGASNDLLDYLSTPVYWQSRHVQVTAHEMLAQLADPAAPDISALIDQLADPDPRTRDSAFQSLGSMGGDILPQLRARLEQGDPQIAVAARQLIGRIGPLPKATSVHRLMAIRALGELGAGEALSALRPLLKSTQPFEADYAAAAIAAIERQPYSRPTLTAAACSADVWAMPLGCSAVLQVRARPGHALIADPLAMLLAGNPAPQAEQAINVLHNQLIAFAEAIGNVRLQSATVGVSGVLDQTTAYLIITLRGQFDAKAVRAELQKQKIHQFLVADFPIYEANFNWLFIAGDDRLVIILGPEHCPLASIVSALMSGQNSLHNSAPMTRLLATANTGNPIWLAVAVTPAFKRVVPLVASFDSLALSSQDQPGALTLKLTASGKTPAVASATAAELDTAFGTLQSQMRPAPDYYQPLLNAISAIHTQSAGGNLTITAQLPPSLLDAMLQAGAASGRFPVVQH